MAAAYGGYPLHVSTLTTEVLAPLQLSVCQDKYGVLVGDDFAESSCRSSGIGDERPVVNGHPAGYESRVSTSAGTAALPNVGELRAPPDLA